MSRHYDRIAFTRTVSDIQDRTAARRSTSVAERAARLTALPAAAHERDSFYLAIVSETGWPSVPLRGGPPGFLRVIDAHTLGWADYRGKLQYVSMGNVARDNRVAMIVMDYANQQRLRLELPAAHHAVYVSRAGTSPDGSQTADPPAPRRRTEAVR
jgi:predicted pyridoxine 5'-phosphate oxidase superfamily flavin-nucleotide-binding protein